MLNPPFAMRCNVCESNKQVAKLPAVNELGPPPMSPTLARQLSDEGRHLLTASMGGHSVLSSRGVMADDLESPPAAVPLRRTLTAQSGAVYDNFVKVNTSSSIHGTAAALLQRTSEAAQCSAISQQNKLAIQQVLLQRGISAATAQLEAFLSAPACAGGAAAPATAPFDAKKKKKKKSGYAAMMAGAMDTSDEDGRQQAQEAAWKKTLGGGAFSKLDKI